MNLSRVLHVVRGDLVLFWIHSEDNGNHQREEDVEKGKGDLNFVRKAAID
jgi:hypothetical protein